MTTTQLAAIFGVSMILAALVACAPDIERTTSLAPETSLHPVARPAGLNTGD
jgi:hypothetical protein